MDSIQLLYRVIITDNTLIGLLLVFGLVLMAVISGGCATSHFRRYRITESDYLNQAKTRLRSLRSKSDEPSEGEKSLRLSNLVSAEELAQGVPPDSIIGDRLRMIALLRQSQTKVSLSALQQISRAREAARTSLRFPGVAVNLLMLVGLLGTFIGIAIVIQQIGLNIGQGDGSLESFGKAFGGMYTKFSTTLVGMACAIVLASLNFRLAQAQERFFEDLDRFTVSELLPATIPALEDETLLERISQQLEQSFSLIEEIADKNAKTGEAVGAIQAGFADIVSNIRQQVRSEGPDRLHTLLGQMAGVIDQVSRVNDALHNLASELPKALTASNRRLEEAITSRSFEPAFQSTPKEHRLPYIMSFIAFGAAVLVLFITIVVRR